jgi:hypothetical protein
MGNFFDGTRNKAFVAGLVGLFASVYLKDRLPLDEAQLKWVVDNASLLLSSWIVSRALRKPEMPKVQA